MSTKDACLFFKDSALPKSKSFTHQTSQQYTNLNLNQNLKTSDVTSHQYLSNSINSKKIAATIKSKDSHLLHTPNDGKVKQHSLSKSSLIGFNASKGNIFKEETIKKNKSYTNNKINDNSSTLSLHIAAYENANETCSDTKKEDESSSKMKESSTKKWKNAKHIFNGSTLSTQNSYEFPRQQRQGRANDPEVMQYRASQRLFNSNQDTTSKRLNMVHLISLKMQGVRSIGSEAHVINFLQPLTLIQGPNGTGKTTIIEALNYVTSGCLPSGKLATFIHDPKVANKTRVDGVIQLKFEDVKGNDVTATKRMTSSISKTVAGISAKSDESTLLTMKDGKETSSISSKVGDFYVNVMTALGVNKAVLDYVIFCHQEESNWPLNEPKKLKERFDEIFEVSEYVEVMENVKTERKVLDKKIIELDTEIQNHLEGYVIRSNALHNEIEEGTKKLEKSGTDLEKLNAKLKGLEKQLSEASAKKKKLDQLKSQLEIKRAVVAGKEENLASIQVADYHGNMDELQKELSEAENKKDYQEIKKKQDEFDKQISRIVVELKNIGLESAQIQRQINDLEVQKQRKNDIEDERNKLIEAIRKKYSIDEEDGDIEEAMKKIKANKEAEKKELLESSKSEIDQIQQDLSAANISIANVDATKRSKEADISRLKREIIKIEKDLEQIGASAERSNKLEKEIAKLEASLSGQEALSALEKQNLDRQIAISETKREIEEFSKVITAENDYTKKSEEFKNLWKKSEKQMAELFEKPPERNINRQLGTLKMDLEKNLSIADKLYTNAEKEMSKISEKLAQLKIKNEFNDSIVKQNQEQISQIGVEPDEVKDKLEKIRSDLKEYRDQLGEKQGSQFLYKKWEEQIAKEKSCPLCEKACGSTTDVQKLVTKVKKRHADLPSEIEELTDSVAKFEIQERNLTQVLPLVEKMETILNQTAEDLNEIEGIEKQKASKEKEKEAARKKMEEARKKLDAAKNLLGDAKLLDKLIEDQKAAEEIKSNAREDLSEYEKQKDWSLEQFEEARDEAQVKLETLDAEAKKSDAKLKEIRSKSAELQKLKEEKLKIGEKALQPAILTKSKEEKEARIQECQDEASACDAQIPDLKKNQRKLKANLDQTNAALETKKSEIDTFLNRFLRNFEAFKTLNSRLEDIVLDENGSKDLEKKMKGFDERKSELERKKVQLEADKTSVSNKQEKVRTLKDQLTKKLLLDDVATMNGEILELEEKIDGLAGIEKEIRDSQIRFSNFNSQRSAILGQRGPLEEAIKKAKKQLLEPNIQKAVENYRDKYCEKCLNEEMSKDLDTYIKCLDGAIIAFHTLKMERINIILQELWSTVYDGNDIEAIRIKSDPVSASDKRKSYNYSVVMIVDGKELEMRDRCSAGQKVLASILIRIALAEVFAANCPILALDEPTTNLDTDKIDNIGHMLAKLLEAREDHIQLIVITHDIQLVRLLHLSCRPEYVYGLSKNEYGVSLLKEHTKLNDNEE